MVYKVMRTGMQWSELFLLKSSFKTIYNRYRIWVKHEVFEIVYKKIINLYKTYNSKKKFVKYYATDTIMIKSIMGQDIVGKNPTDRGRNGSKISVIVDNFGIPWSIHMHEANRNDCILLKKVLEEPICSFEKNLSLYADKGYDSALCREQTKNHNLNPKIAKRKTTSPIDYEKSRYIVENSFSWIKQYRRLVLRYDRKAVFFKSMVYFGFANIVSNKMDKMRFFNLI